MSTFQTSLGDFLCPGMVFVILVRLSRSAVAGWGGFIYAGDSILRSVEWANLLVLGVLEMYRGSDVGCGRFVIGGGGCRLAPGLIFGAFSLYQSCLCLL